MDDDETSDIFAGPFEAAFGFFFKKKKHRPFKRTERFVCSHFEILQCRKAVFTIPISVAD